MNLKIFCVLLCAAFTVNAFFLLHEKGFAQTAAQAAAQRDGNPIRTRICLFSDMNGPYGSVALPESVHAGITRMSEMNCDLALGAGDLVAGQDTSLSTERIHAMWDEWKRVVAEPFLKRGVPVLSALGNHDASAERSSSGGFVFQRERDAAAEQWNSLLGHSALAAIKWLSQDKFPFYYSFIFGTTGIIVFDGTSAGEVSRNRPWLEQQLAAMSADASIRTRLIVGHLPLFAVAKGRETAGNVIYDSSDIYALLNKHSVDFYVSGHHHAFYPARPHAPSPLYGTVQLALGAMGDGPRRLLDSAAPAPRHSMTVLDIQDTVMPSSNFVFERFNIQTMSPFNGIIQHLQDLPESIESFTGRGQPVELHRFDKSNVR